MTSRCPITYELVERERGYSQAGLRSLHNKLTHLEPLAWSAAQQREEALARAAKMSIQGIQPKLSALLSPGEARFDITDRGGAYILKPQSGDYPHLPENEDLTMRFAKIAGIETPKHGLLWCVDGSLTYFIKRFDRAGRRKVALEDFAQLLGMSRSTKYNSSMEQAAVAIESFCTFPAVEKLKLFRLTLFSFLTGNEDMHLKNLSLIQNGETVELSPAYDLLNSTLVLKKPKEELALPIRGKRARIAADDIFDYFAGERLALNERVISDVVADMKKALPQWEKLLGESFLSVQEQERYRKILDERVRRVL
jgi:serine/threonine-protein kinase HipA